jgi:hypothetical protein
MTDAPSRELDDYSGPFQPDFELKDLSKEALIKLVEVGGTIYGHVTRCWYRAVEARFGAEAAHDCHHEVWFEKGGAGDVENETLGRLFGFSRETDETAPMKVNQLLPAMATRMKLVFEERGEHDWLMKAQRCHVPEMGEAAGPEQLRRNCETICYHLELFGFRWGARKWNRNIRVDPLKLPPRGDASEPHCCWRYTLQDEPPDYAKEPGELVEKMGLQRPEDGEI